MLWIEKSVYRFEWSDPHQVEILFLNFRIGRNIQDLDMTLYDCGKSMESPEILWDEKISIELIQNGIGNLSFSKIKKNAAFLRIVDLLYK